MRLTAIQPDERYMNLDRRSFVCECGMSNTDLIARFE